MASAPLTRDPSLDLAEIYIRRYGGLRMTTKTKIVASITAAGIILSACDQDIFGLSCKALSGAYCLRRWESGAFYIDTSQSNSNPSFGGGVAGGIVQRVGWNNAYLIAYRQPIMSDERAGWIIIDVKSGRVTGPYSEDYGVHFAMRNDIQVKTSEEAWKTIF